MKKSLILTGFSIVVIVLFFLLPRHSKWLDERIFPYYRNMVQQQDELDIEHRKQVRHGASYILSQLIAGHFKEKELSDSVLVLMPPAKYFSKNGIEYPVPEPAVFYYFTGIKTVWANSKIAEKANWFVTAKDGQIHFTRVNNKKLLQDTIQFFKRSGYPL